MEEAVSIIALLTGVLILAGFYNLCHRLGQIRDDNHAIKIMLENELIRAAKDRYAAVPRVPVQPGSGAQ